MKNWERHFQEVSRRHRQPATFGSFLGMSTEKTIADLRFLIKAKDDQMAQLENYVRGKSGIDPDWTKDYNNLKARYRSARDAAQHALDSGLSSGFLGKPIDRFFEGFTTAEHYYDAILKSLMQSYPDLHVTKGDAQDVFNRMPFAMRAPPQPGTLPSSQVYQTLDTAAKYAPDPVKAAVAYLDPPLVPKTADAPTYKKAEDKLAAGANWITKNLTLVAIIAGGIAIVSLNRK
jgi:hypothetical protein